MVYTIYMRPYLSLEFHSLDLLISIFDCFTSKTYRCCVGLTVKYQVWSSRYTTCYIETLTSDLLTVQVCDM